MSQGELCQKPFQLSGSRFLELTGSLRVGCCSLPDYEPGFSVRRFHFRSSRAFRPADGTLHLTQCIADLLLQLAQLSNAGLQFWPVAP